MDGQRRCPFTPEVIAAVMPTKAPVERAGIFIPLTDWTGFYVGGFRRGFRQVLYQLSAIPPAGHKIHS